MPEAGHCHARKADLTMGDLSELRRTRQLNLSERRRCEDVLPLNDDVAPKLGPRHGVVEKPALMLDVAADLVRPDNYDPVKLPVLGLLHGHRSEVMRCTISALSA